ncbi:MAG: trypsin-like peptidase domain-containing protein [Chloroflexi bacterium]|nr:trypsin-like peptidase domain-containing protein [Chloroflexota bacterium]
MNSFRRFFIFPALGLALLSTGCAPLISNLQGASPAAAVQPAATPSPVPSAGLAPAPSQETPQDSLTRLETASLPNVAAAVASTRPAVVSIYTQTLSPQRFFDPVPREGAGSGVVIDREGHVLTNNHVVEGARSLRVVLPDGRSFDDVELVGRDPRTDLAVLRIQGADLPVAPLGSSSALQIGEWVIAIGNALGLEGGPTVTAGVVSALGRGITTDTGCTLYDLIQTDAAINPGNSGGPLLNLRGEVVGIDTAIAGQGTGIGFAISINQARPIVQQLIERGKVREPWMGVKIATVTPGIASQLRLSIKEGVAIVEVVPQTPAAAAGLRAGDVIVGLNGDKVATTAKLIAAIQPREPGDQITLSIVRDGRELSTALRLAESPRTCD